MNPTQFHAMRTALQDNAFPGRPRDLAEVGSALRELLLAGGIFRDVEVERTDDPDQLVIAMCTFDAGWSEVDVARHLEQVWRDRLAYPCWEAHSVLVDRGFVELLAATRHSTGGHYVTVHLVAQKALVPAQRGPVD